MPDFNFNSHFESQNRPPLLPSQEDAGVNGNLGDDKDLLMEQILENINTTPIGQVLKKIACLPEVRRKKIMNVRQQLTEGKYDLKKHLDIALDKALEELTAKGNSDIKP
jgi:hypothetical protein